jgi:hypothetical protein
METQDMVALKEAVVVPMVLALLVLLEMAQILVDQEKLTTELPTHEVVTFNIQIPQKQQIVVTVETKEVLALAV